MNIYERLIEILVEQKKEERTKPSSTKAQKAANKAKAREAMNKKRHDELEAEYGDTGIWKGDRP